MLPQVSEGESSTQHVELWSFHKPGFSLTTGRVDWNESEYYNRDPKTREAYHQLRGLIATDQIIWCCLNQNDWPVEAGHVSWHLSVPRHGIFWYVDECVWNKLRGEINTHVPDCIRQSIIICVSNAHPDDEDANDRERARLYAEYWDSVGGIDDLLHGHYDPKRRMCALVRHPVPPEWVIHQQAVNCD